jgi:ferredoxin
VKVLKGDVTMSYEDGLDTADKAEGYVLSCFTIVKSDCVLGL